jgi:hypothetical protein
MRAGQESGGAISEAFLRLRLLLGFLALAIELLSGTA